MWNSIALYDKHATITTHVAKALHLFQYVKSILLMGRYRWTWLIHCNGQRDLRPLLHNNPGLCSWLVWQHTQIRQCLFTFLSHSITHTYIFCITVVRRQFYSKSGYDHASNRDNNKHAFTMLLHVSCNTDANARFHWYMCILISCCWLQVANCTSRYTKVWEGKSQGAILYSL